MNSVLTKTLHVGPPDEFVYISIQDAKDMVCPFKFGTNLLNANCEADNCMAFIEVDNDLPLGRCARMSANNPSLHFMSDAFNEIASSINGISHAIDRQTSPLA